MAIQLQAKSTHVSDVHVRTVPRIMPLHVSKNWTVHSTAHVRWATQASNARNVLMDTLVIP